MYCSLDSTCWSDNLYDADKMLTGMYFDGIRRHQPNSNCNYL